MCTMWKGGDLGDRQGLTTRERLSTVRTRCSNSEMDQRGPLRSLMQGSHPGFCGACVRAKSLQSRPTLCGL